MSRRKIGLHIQQTHLHEYRILHQEHAGFIETNNILYSKLPTFDRDVCSWSLFKLPVTYAIFHSLQTLLLVRTVLHRVEVTLSGDIFICKEGRDKNLSLACLLFLTFDFAAFKSKPGSYQTSYRLPKSTKIAHESVLQEESPQLDHPLH
jgi:hypothetical protein